MAVIFARRPTGAFVPVWVVGHPARLIPSFTQVRFLSPAFCFVLAEAVALTDWNETNRLTVVTSPVSEPVAVANVKAYAQIDSGFTADDTLLSGFGKQARDWCERHTGRRFGEYQYDLRLDAFPTCGIELPFPPLVSVDGVYYIGSDGIEAELAASEYRVDSVDENRTARIVRAYGVTWPTPQATTNAVRVRFTCGYSTVPDLLLNSAYDYAKSLYDHAAPDLEKLQLWLAPYVVHRWG